MQPIQATRAVPGQARRPTNPIERKPAPRRKPADRTLLLIVALLVMAGLLTLFSATYYQAQDHGDALREVKQQLVGNGLARR